MWNEEGNSSESDSGTVFDKIRMWLLLVSMRLVPYSFQRQLKKPKKLLGREGALVVAWIKPGDTIIIFIRF